MDSDQQKNRGFVVSHHHQSNAPPPPEMDSDQEKNRGFVVSHHHQSNSSPPPEPPSAFPPPQFPPPPSLPPYYGTFQGIPTYPPSTGIPQPGAASSYYNTTHAYQSVPVPGYAVDEERPLMRDDRLPCCGIGLGWCLFLLGFFFGAIPWYIGAVILLCRQRRVDYREKPGYILCTIAAALATVAIILGASKGDNDWDFLCKGMFDYLDC